MENGTTYYIELITRYFSGEATPEEIRDLEIWVKAAPENIKQFLAYHKTWNAIENARIDKTLNIDNEWNNLKSKLPTSQSSPRPSSLLPRPSSLVPRPSSFVLRPSFYRIAALFLLLMIPSFLLYHSLALPGEIQVASADGISEYALPDGTKVTLNEDAALSYPERFDGAERKVTLTGEAWFEVTHDAAKPFVVSAGKALVRVLGTTFSVNSGAPGMMSEVILVSGMVKVTRENNPGNPVFLAPGEKATIMDGDQAIIKMVNADLNFLAWKTKRLIFRNTPLNEVAAQLSKVYQTRILVSGNGLSNCSITATFDRQSLETVLNVLKATLDLQVQNSGNGIILSGKGCN